MRYPIKITILFIIIFLLGVFSIIMYLNHFLNNIGTTDIPEVGNSIASLF